MAYVLRNDGDILRVEFSGTFTNQDLAHGAVDVAELEDASAIVPSRVADLRRVKRLEIDFTGVLAFVEARRRRRFPNQFKTAIIATNLVDYAFARMFQTLNDHPQIVIAIFGDEADALDWVRLSDFTAPRRRWRLPLDQTPPTL